MILSIDVGIRNLAMCMLDETSNLIVQWDVSGVPPEHKDGLFVSLRDHLDDKPWVLQADTVLIEKQPDKNRKMKIVEHFLHAYFVIRNPKAETIIYDARFKIPDFAGPGKVMYTKRKKASIERCQQFIWNNTVNAHWIPIFNASKKKDDLAGYFELIFHSDLQEIEIAYFGLLEEYHNKKLGGYLLSTAIKKSFEKKDIKRVWVHTCTLDHENALKNYLARGMKIFKTETIAI